MPQNLPDLPNVDAAHFRVPVSADLAPAIRRTHAPRFLLLYGSARERSYSRLLTMEAARLLGIGKTTLYRKLKDYGALE